MFWVIVVCVLGRCGLSVFGVIVVCRCFGSLWFVGVLGHCSLCFGSLWLVSVLGRCGWSVFRVNVVGQCFGSLWLVSVLGQMRSTWCVRSLPSADRRCQGRWSSASSFSASLLQAIAGVTSPDVNDNIEGIFFKCLPRGSKR